VALGARRTRAILRFRGGVRIAPPELVRVLSFPLFACLLGLLGLSSLPGCTAQTQSECDGVCDPVALHLYVRDVATGLPVCDATVVASTDDGGPDQVLFVGTAPDGSCEYAGGSAFAQYHVRVTAAGYEPTEVEATVHTNEEECCPAPQTVSVGLTPAP
jgi:hypothetical protein